MTVLVADDDCMLTREALEELRLADKVLPPRRRGIDGLSPPGGEFGDPAAAPRPRLIVVDPSKPRVAGRLVLREIKAYRRCAASR